jgi:hypothetical protein
MQVLQEVAGDGPRRGRVNGVGDSTKRAAQETRVSLELLPAVLAGGVDEVVSFN